MRWMQGVRWWRVPAQEVPELQCRNVLEAAMNEVHFWQAIACGLALAVVLQAIVLVRVVT
jgi:hypothetical protein